MAFDINSINKAKENKINEQKEKENQKEQFTRDVENTINALGDKCINIIQDDKFEDTLQQGIEKVIENGNFIQDGETMKIPYEIYMYFRFHQEQDNEYSCVVHTDYDSIDTFIGVYIGTNNQFLIGYKTKDAKFPDVIKIFPIIIERKTVENNILNVTHVFNEKLIDLKLKYACDNDCRMVNNVDKKYQSSWHSWGTMNGYIKI